MKFVTSIKDYQKEELKLFTRGTWYVVLKEKQDKYFLYNNYGHKMWIDRDLFVNGIQK